MGLEGDLTFSANLARLLLTDGKVSFSKLNSCIVSRLINCSISGEDDPNFDILSDLILVSDRSGSQFIELSDSVEAEYARDILVRIASGEIIHELPKLEKENKYVRKKTIG